MFDLLSSPETLAPLALPLRSGTTRQVIADGPRGTAQTIAQMQKLVNSGKHDNAIRKLCGDILNPENGPRQVASKDYFQYAKKLYEFVRNNILYMYDPVALEYCESARTVLKNRVGDCDSMDILLCSMFEHAGMPSQFVTIKADRNRPDEYTHVYTRVLVPKVGWVCADPIMPEKWFGWEPPFPEGKKYWPASSDAAKQTVDTTPSVQIDGPGQAPQPAFDLGISGLSGLSGLGRGGHRHGGGGRRWGGGGYGWGPGYGYSEPDVYVLPVVVDNRVPTPDLVSVVPDEDTSIQAQENPAMEYSAGMGYMGAFGDGVFDSVINAAGAALSPLGSALNTVTGWVTGTDMSDAAKLRLAQQVIDGSMAKDINTRRAKLNTNSDLAYKYVQTARKANNSKALTAANAFADAARQEQYKLNDTVAKYNEASGIINSVSGGYYTPPKVGMSALGIAAVPITAVITYAAVSAALIALAVALRSYANAPANTEDAKVNAFKALREQGLSPDSAAQAVYGSKATSPAPGNEQSWGDYFKSFASGSKDTVFNYALIIGGTFVAWQVLKYAGGLADTKIRSQLETRGR